LGLALAFAAVAFGAAFGFAAGLQALTLGRRDSLVSEGDQWFNWINNFRYNLKSMGLALLMM